MPVSMISVAVAALQAGVSAGMSKVSIRFRSGPNLTQVSSSGPLSPSAPIQRPSSSFEDWSGVT
jgi:hypothetical protein